MRLGLRPAMYAQNIMSLNFLDDGVDRTKRYNFRFLMYPNITYMKCLARDSYFATIRNEINYINSLRDDCFFTLILPEYTKSVDLPNTEQKFMSFPTYPNLMRCNFNVKTLLDLIDVNSNDYDFVYTHLPEHVLQLKNVLYNTTSIRPRFIGCCDWYEVPENTSYIKTMFPTNIVGTLEMEMCGVNSEWMKGIAMKHASKLFNEATLAKLNEILMVNYIGTLTEYEEGTKKPKTIVFNHRDDSYTCFKSFIAVMDKLYEQRQDFTVYMTMETDVQRPYLKRVDLPSRKDYLSFLRTMSIGVAFFQTYSAWSVSTMDGLSCGVPYLLPNSLCYPEMGGKDYPLFYEGDKEFLVKMNDLLDGKVPAIDFKKINKRLFWKNATKTWFKNWDVFDRGWKVSTTDNVKRIEQYIKKQGSVTKSDLVAAFNWGNQISISEYRNALRENPRIKLTVDGYEYIS